MPPYHFIGPKMSRSCEPRTHHAQKASGTGPQPVTKGTMPVPPIGSIFEYNNKSS